MKTRAYVMLGLALLLAIASVFLAKNWIQNQVQPVAQVEQKPQVESVQIVVAASQLKYGNKLRREHLRLVDWPVSAVPEGSFRSIEDLLGAEKKVGKDGKEFEVIEDRVVLRAIEINEPILTSKVTGFGGRASLSTLITPGMRATTIRVNDVNGVAGFVLPGDRVDILLTRGGKRGGGGGLTTDIMLQNMKVLGIDQDANEDRSKPAVVRAVTLEVTTLQAQKLTLAQKVGTLSLALRHVNTVGAIATETVTLRDLKEGEANVTPDPVKKKAAVAKAEAVHVAKPAVMKTAVKKKKKTNVTIVRGLTAKEYEVQPEKPTFSAPAYSKPLNLLPSKLAPAAAPTPSLAPKLMPATLTPATPKLPSLSPVTPAAGSGGESANDLKTTTLPSSTEPISLLKGSSNAGDDG